MLITTIWQMYGNGADYFFLCSKDAGGKWREHPFHRKDIKKEVPKFLKDYADRDLYFCPHGFSAPKRRKENAVAPRLLWSDMDKCDPSKVRWKPTIAIESSPGRFVGLWLMDRVVTEELNQRLSYAMDVDISGWDYTQVLRVPGTINYKYSSNPRTRIRWTDGQPWEVAKLEKELPRLASRDNDVIDVGTARDIFKKYRSKFKSQFTVSAIRQTTPPSEGKRSEVLHKLFCECVEIGMQKDEAITLLGASVWNKFAGRRTEMQNLEREWEKAADKPHRARQTIAGEDDDEEDGRVWFAKNLDEVEEEALDWVWYPYLARKQLTILQGDPEAGKSFISQNVAGHLCEGKKLPCYVEGLPTVRGPVAYFDLENDAAHVTKARLRWGGYKLGGQFYQEEQPFSIADDQAIAGIIDALSRIKPVLIVFDTLMTYIGEGDSNNASSTMQTMARFKQLAVRLNCAVLVLRHLTKGGRDRAMYRGTGSIAISAFARIEITAGPHPTEEGVRAIARSKGNLTAPPPALCYMIEAAPTKKERDRAEFSFGEFDPHITAEHLVAPPEEKKDDGVMDAAVKFLESELAKGPKDVDALKVMGEARSINQRTLQRAFKKLGGRRVRDGYGDDQVIRWALSK